MANEEHGPVANLPYLTADVPGIGGTIKTFLEDFFVEEVPLYEPIDEGTHVFFCIEKRQVDTLKAVRTIADALGRRAFEIGAAGLKDARAVSRQILSVEHVEPAAIEALNLPDIRVLWARRHRNKLKLGHLRGNKFVIKLRDVRAGRQGRRPGHPGDPPQARRAELLRPATIRHAGRHLADRPGDRQAGRERGDRRPVRPAGRGATRRRSTRPGELYDAGRFDEAWKIWPYNCREERIAVKAMSKAKGSHRRALFAIDRSVKRLYVSAYQSWLFNQILAERIRLNALDQVWPGDMAWLHDRGAVFLVEDAAAEQPRADRLEISPSGPLFGSRTTMAQGRAGEMETALLASQDVTPEHFRNVKGQKVRGARGPCGSR